MIASGRNFFSRLNHREFLQLCNEKLTCAARDLAEFTKNGITAGYIVALAHKCEDLESSLAHSQQRDTNRESDFAEQEIQEAIDRICTLGRTIFSSEPSKYQDYLMPQALVVSDDSVNPGA